MWTVTTESELIDERESRRHPIPAQAWDDYNGRILELDIDGFTKGAETATEYGRRWVAELNRGLEHINVVIERLRPSSDESLRLA
jgi:hypothetical protein